MADTLLDRYLGTASLLVELDGQPIELERLGPVSIRHGRSTPDGQPEASTVTLTTNAEVIPTVGQELTVQLGADALEAFGLEDGEERPGNLAAGRTWVVPNVLNATHGQVAAPDADGWQQVVKGSVDNLVRLGGSSSPIVGMVAGEPTSASVELENTHTAAQNLRLDLGDSALSATALLQPGERRRVYLSGAVPSGVMPNFAFLDVTTTPAGASGPFKVRRPRVELGTTAQPWAWSPRFVGKVTDSKVIPAPGTSSRRRRVQVTAVGPKAQLGRQLVGDTPWPAELDGPRVARLLDLATGVTVGAIDTGTVQLLARDVDRQPLLKLLDDAATDAEGLVVELRDGTLTYQDADHRTAAVTQLELDATQVLWPLTWSQDLQGLVNDLTVGWGAAEPQEEVRVIDQASVDVHGLYAAKVSTKLATEAAAQAYADLTVARRSRPWWDVDTMALELVRGVPGLAAQLLALEVSALLQVTGFATDAPLQLGRLWVEGWAETITDKAWTLVLAVSPYGRTGPAARWADVPADVTWADLDPALSWAGAASWDPGGQPDGRWVGTPHDLTWATVDPGLTWATWPY